MMGIKVAENIKSLVPYEPGKPVEELARELQIQNIVKLASNENPIGPSPVAVAALKEYLPNINRYPDGGGFYLKRKLCEVHNIASENIILGNGSNELLELAARTFLTPGEEAVMADRSFVVYRMVTQAAAAKKIVVPIKDFNYDLDSMAKAVTERTRLLFIANPNNPTGTSIGKNELDRLLNKLPDSLILVIDEAYSGYEDRIDFPDSLEYLRTGKNVVILRTFSKIYGLAGLRIGYGIAKKEIVGFMNRVRQPFNTNAMAQIAAIAALSDTSHIDKSREINRVGKKYLYSEFQKMGIPYVPTDANFILADVGKGRIVYEQLLREGVIVRAMDGYSFTSHIRVTIGTPDQNKKFISALQKVIDNLQNNKESFCVK